jgi:hypothetical protein
MLIISISTHLFIHLTIQKKKKKEIIQNIYRYIVKNIKKRRFFFYIVREENIRPQVLRDKIAPSFFQHYGKKIYHIVSLVIFYSLSIGYHHKMTKKNPSSIFRVQRFWKIFRQSDPTKYLNTTNICRKWFRIVRHNEFYWFNYLLCRSYYSICISAIIY